MLDLATLLAWEPWRRLSVSLGCKSRTDNILAPISILLSIWPVYRRYLAIIWILPCLALPCLALSCLALSCLVMATIKGSSDKPKPGSSEP
jgi:hypothetical protein